MNPILLEGLLNIAVVAAAKGYDADVKTANDAMQTIRDLEKDLKDEKDKTDALESKRLRQKVREYHAT